MHETNDKAILLLVSLLPYRLAVKIDNRRRIALTTEMDCAELPACIDCVGLTGMKDGLFNTRIHYIASLKVLGIYSAFE